MTFFRSHRSPSVTHQQSPHGFTFVEVLAGILMAMVFVLITTQAVFISAVFRVKAQRTSEALNWIQQDLEDIKFRASFNIDAETCEATTTTDGYAQALITQITTATTSPYTDTPPTVIQLLNKDYEVTRTFGVYNEEPFSIMTIEYSVVNPDNNESIADYYTEVVPDAAFECQ